jgi:5-hydroxyisourate hydrolase
LRGRLTTHVLDTAHGRPAAGLEITLWALGTDGKERRGLKTVRTNQDGRVDGPLLAEDEFVPGRYELVFAVGAYFAELDDSLPSPPFLDEVPVRFGIAEADSHYHVPLLVSPWAYSTYRGS